MEGILNDQMNEFSEETGLLHPGVHGYRTGMSTTTALLEIQGRLIRAVEEGNLSSLCLLDLSSGFDTVNTTYLLRKLERYGYSDCSLEWISSFLNQRSQIVQVQAARSKEILVRIGFPQGGPMSPTFFREYSNDIPACVVSGCLQWRVGEEEDRKTVRRTGRVETSPISKAIKFKSEVEMTKDEKWDRQLQVTENEIEC